MAFVFSQICGGIVFVAAILSLQQKKIKNALICQLICNGLGALTYVLLGDFSGGGIYLIAVVQSIVYFVFRAKDKKAPPILAVVFVLAFAACSALTYQTPTDLIAAVAALTCALSLSQKKASGYRIFTLANGLLWIFYDISVGAYTMVITHAATAISAGIGMVRLDLGRKRSKEK